MKNNRRALHKGVSDISQTDGSSGVTLSADFGPNNWKIFTVDDVPVQPLL